MTQKVLFLHYKQLKIKKMGIKPNTVKSVIIDAKSKKAPTKSPTLSPSDQLFNDKDAVEFASFGKDVKDEAKKLEDAGLYTINSGNPGSGSANVVRLSGNAKSFEDLTGVDRTLHSMIGRGLQIAKSKGIKSAAEFKDRADEIFKEAAGSDYDLMKFHNMIPNIGSAVGKIYEQRLKEYVPAKNRYVYNSSTGNLDPIPGMGGTSTPAVSSKIEEIKNAPTGKNVKLKVSTTSQNSAENNPNFVGPKIP